MTVCDCAEGYERVFTPAINASAWGRTPRGKFTSSISPTCPVCSESDQSCAIVRTIQAPYAMACAESHVNATGPAVGGGVGATVAIALVLGLAYRRRANKRLDAVRQELEKFKDSVVGVRAVSVDYDPRADNVGVTADGLTPGTSSETVAALGGTEGVEALEAGFQIQAEELPGGRRRAAPRVCARWYWKDNHNIGKHAKHDVKQPGNYVVFQMGVCNELDTHYASFLWVVGHRAPSSTSPTG